MNKKVMTLENTLKMKDLTLENRGTRREKFISL